MTLTSVITLNAVVGAAVTYSLLHFLALGIKAHREAVEKVVPLREAEARRIAA